MFGLPEMKMRAQHLSDTELDQIINPDNPAVRELVEMHQAALEEKSRREEEAERERCALLEADGIPVHARRLHEADLLAADAAWCTNALVGVMPVRTIGSPRSAGLASLPHQRRRHAASVRARLFAPHT